MKMQEEIDALRKKKEEEDASKERNKLDQQQNVKEDIAQQLKDKESQRAREYQEFLREKAMIDDIVNSIHEEDQLAEEERFLSREGRRKELDK